MGLEQKRTEEGSAPISSFHTHLPRGSKKGEPGEVVHNIYLYLSEASNRFPFPARPPQTKERR